MYIRFMKFPLLLIVITIFIPSCIRSNKAIKERIANADSVAINYFKNDGTMDAVVAVKIIRDKAILEKLTGFISAASANESSNCGIAGSLHFFKMDRVVQDVDFAMDDKKGCMQFRFKMSPGSAWTVAELPSKVKLLLESLRNK